MITQATIYDLQRERDRLAALPSATQKQKEALSRFLTAFKGTGNPLLGQIAEQRTTIRNSENDKKLRAIGVVLELYDGTASEEPAAIKPVIEVVLEEEEEQPVVIAAPKYQTPREKAVTKRTELRDAVRDILGNNPTPMRTKDIVNALRGKDIEFGESTLSALLNRSTIMFTSPHHGYWELVRHDD